MRWSGASIASRRVSPGRPSRRRSASLSSASNGCGRRSKGAFTADRPREGLAGFLPSLLLIPQFAPLGRHLQQREVARILRLFLAASRWWKHSDADNMMLSTVWAGVKLWAYPACSVAKLGSSRARRPHPAEIMSIGPAPAFPSAIRDSRPSRRAEGVRKLPRICLKACGPTMDETAARPHLEPVHVRAGVLFEQLFGLTYQVFVRPGFQHVDGLNPLIADEVAAHPPKVSGSEPIARAKRSIRPVTQSVACSPSKVR